MSMFHVRICGLKQEGGECFQKIFTNIGVRLKIQLNQLIDLPVQLIIKSITGI